MALPVGALAFNRDTDHSPRLPSGITVRGWVDASGDATVWLGSHFRVDAPTPYTTLCRSGKCNPPEYRAGIHRARAMVEHRGEIYQNGKNCDVHSPHPQSGLGPPGERAREGVVPGAVICSTGACRGGGRAQRPLPPSKSARANKPSTNAPPVPDMNDTHALTVHHAKDDTYRLDFQDAERPYGRDGGLTLHNRAPEQIAILPRPCVRGQVRSAASRSIWT